MATSPSQILSIYTVNSSMDDSNCQLEEENVFCTEDNVEECSSYLSQELEALGMGFVLTQGQPNVVKLLNTVYGLVQYSRRLTKQMDDVNDSLLRARSDCTLQTEAVNRLKVVEEDLHRCVSVQKEAERQLSLRNRTLSAKLKIEKEEVRRLQQCQLYEEQKYLHKVKRKDREFLRLKDRLGQLVLNKSQEKKLGIKVLNTLQKQRKTWDSASHSSEDTYKLIISHYEGREKELMLENSSLRESLLNMEKELAGMLNERLSDYHTASTNRIEGTDDGSPSGEACEQSELLDSGLFRMPFDLMREDIEESLREKYQKLRQHIEYLKEFKEKSPDPDSHATTEWKSGAQSDHIQAERLDNYEAEIEDLLRQLSSYEEIIAQQEEVILRSIKSKENGGKKPVGSIMSPSHLVRKVEDLEKKERRIKEREHLVVENERKLVTATHTLDRERQDFEDQKGKFYKQQFLESSIFVTPSRSQPTQLNSFFAGISSTPFMPSAAKSVRRSHRNYGNTRSSSSSPSPYCDTPHKENIVFGSPVLTNGNVSLSSDDGSKVINAQEQC